MKMEKCREDIKVLCLQRSGQERKLVFMSPLCLIITVLLPLAKFKFVGFPYKRGGGGGSTHQKYPFPSDGPMWQFGESNLNFEYCISEFKFISLMQSYRITVNNQVHH